MGNLTIGTKIGVCLAVLTALILGWGFASLAGVGGNRQEFAAIASDLAAQSRELERGGSTVEAARSRVGALAARLEAANREQEAGGAWIWLLMAAGVAVAVAGWFQVAQSTGQLGKLAAQILDGADQVAGAASQVASASQSLAQGAAEQAASLEETSASSEELTSMTRKNSENAQNAAGLADVSQNKVEQANVTLGQMVGSMNEITSSSGKISKIIKVIDEIAFQTNILALNAAVEAARAGEAGMGFAVVADEVRSLAQRCAQAAKDTASLIEESIQKSTAGGEHLSQVVAAVSSITQSASEIKILAQEVNLGSQEQARGIEQISKAIVQMQSVTQRTAANAEQGAAASEQMSAQASSLKAFSSSLLSILGSERAALSSGSGARSKTPASSRAAAPRPARATSTESLGSLHKAVGANRAQETALPLPVRNAEQEFPLDNDFREF